MPFGIEVSQRIRAVSLAVLETVLITLTVVGAVAQRQLTTRPKDSTTKDLRIAPGKTLSEGSNKTPLDPLQILTYKLEEVALPEPVTAEVRGKEKEFHSVLRLTIMSALSLDAHLIWIDDASLPVVWGVGENGVGALIYDRSILKDGASISLSRGGEVYELQEQLRLPKSLKAAIESETIEAGNSYKLRSVLRIMGSVRESLVEIEFQTSRAFPIINASYGVQIGKRFFPTSAPGGRAVVNLTPKEFAQLKDGERIAISTAWVNYAALGTAAWYFGRLDKSKLDR